MSEMCTLERRRKSRRAFAVAVGCLALLASATAQVERAGRGGPGTGQPSDFRTDVPAHAVDVILGRPTADGVTLSVLAYRNLQGYVAYGTESGAPTAKTPSMDLREGQPVEIVLRSLQPSTRYYCRLSYHEPGAAALQHTPERSFHTRRPPGSAFTFTITADSHLDENTEPAVYAQTLANVGADQPDFHIDLGDTFMTGKYSDGPRAALKQYLAQRYYFGLACDSAPLFLVLGNHDGEPGVRGDTGALALRKRYFPNPEPDAFYTGNGAPEGSLGLLQDYYAWEWGDALFIVLDPYWYSRASGRQRDDGWSRTLGEAQYRWLQRTLEGSKARLRFVFIHHLVGGLGKDARGGIEAAGLFEWGGRGADGSDQFREKRPGWDEPIHQLLARHHVAAVFHGHDHLFAKQERDGIVYQLVPQPGYWRRGGGRRNDWLAVPPFAAEYGYAQGTLLPSPGHLRVRVAEGRAAVDYVRACLPADETGERKNGEVSCSYTVGAGP